MFDWDEHNERHVARHRVTKGEIRQAFADPLRLGRALGVVDGEERHVLIGATRDGRVIRTIYTWRGGKIRPVTAYPIRRGAEFRAYRDQPR